VLRGYSELLQSAKRTAPPSAALDLRSDRLPTRFASFVARAQGQAFTSARLRAPAIGEVAACHGARATSETGRAVGNRSSLRWSLAPMPVGPELPKEIVS
jgi:hypothetical protein